MSQLYQLNVEGFRSVALPFKDVEWSALFYAAKNGHLKIAEMLIKAGANVLLKDKVNSHTLFLCTIQWQSIRWPCACCLT